MIAVPVCTTVTCGTNWRPSWAICSLAPRVATGAPATATVTTAPSTGLPGVSVTVTASGAARAPSSSAASEAAIRCRDFTGIRVLP